MPFGQILGDQRVGQPHDALLVGMPDDKGAVTVSEYLAQRGDLADRFERADLDDGEGFVEPNRLTLPQGGDFDVGRARQAHLATRREHVDRLVVVSEQQDAVAAGRLPQPVDFLSQRQ